MDDEEIVHEDEEQEDEEEEIPLTKKGKSSATTSPSRSVNKKSQIFGGLNFHLYKVYGEIKELKELISSYPYNIIFPFIVLL